MIPIKLDIEGLYSYKEKQTIDFTQLTGAGLFGIFGAVGSGKSSILEAVLLALYGSTERLSDRGEKNSMLNLQSDHLLLNFEFNAGKNNSKTYLARYSAKRNPKNFEDVKPAEHTFYERINGEWEPVSARADEIVGMKKEHFKQTVIIPQGKFREFIDLTPGPRAEMMKELFGLERFDLSRKTGSLLKVVREEKIRLDTQLSALEFYSVDLLKEKESKLTELQKETSEAKQKLERSEKEIKEKEAQREKHQQLQRFLMERRELASVKPEIERQRILHSEFIIAKNHLQPVWERINETAKEFEKYSVSEKKCSDFSVVYGKEIAVLEKEEEELKIKNKERPQREGKIRDLKKVIDILDWNKKLVHANRIIETLQPEIESNKASQKLLEKSIADLEKQTEEIASIDSSYLVQLMADAKDWTNQSKLLDKLEDEINKLSQEEKNKTKEIESLKSSLPQHLASLEIWQYNQKSLIKQLEFDRDILVQKQGLAAHVQLLHDGEACPLCGSLEHPSPLEAKADEILLSKKYSEIGEAKVLLEKIGEIIQKKSELDFVLSNHRQNIEEKIKAKSEEDSIFNQLKSRLSIEGISSEEELNSKISIIQKSSKQKEALLKEVKTLRSQWNSERSQLEKSESDFQKAQIDLQSVHSTISTKKEEIKDQNFCKPFFLKSTEIIQTTIQNVEKDIEDAIQNLDGKQKHLRERRDAQIKNSANLKDFGDRKFEASEKLIKWKTDFESLKKQHGFEEEEKLMRLFQHSLDEEKVAREIRQFDQKLAIAENRIQELESENGISDFLEENYQQLLAEFISHKEVAETSHKNTLLLEREIHEERDKLKEKADLGALLAKLEIRQSYLSELDRLFKGSGFVKYVSSIYLKELCNTANLRFTKLTKNSLSLEIDDNNTFWVIDYLNGGKKRLLKTLSGGQTFQASLCLALALAEKVKALNQADQSFFFMDEGFGALDKNSLRVVFETLKALRHENRIVGIISHVEDLQQEIGAYVNVELDPERGSQISYSF